MATARSTRVRWSHSWPLVGVVALGGCERSAAIGDAIDRTIDFAVTAPAGPTLHSPYVRGADFEVRAWAGEDDLELSECVLASSDPDILRIEPEGDGDAARAHAYAVGQGQASLLLLDGDGDVVAAREVEVRAPTRVVLRAAAPLFLDRADVPSEVDDVQVVRDGEAVFELEYFDGVTRLHGSGALSVSAPEGLEAWVEREHLFEDRDWLVVQGDALGRHEVELAAGGEPFSAVALNVVEPSAIVEIDLFGQDESNAEAATPLVVIAEARDVSARPIWGVAFDWTLAGAAVEAAGDLFRYDYAPGDAHALAVAIDDVGGALPISAGAPSSAGGSLGCAVAERGSQGPGAVALALLLVVGAGVRRPRRAR